MYSLIIITIFINKLINSNAMHYLEEQANYLKPKLERNNVLNKGLWMRDKIEKSNYGDFIFRTDLGQVDNLIQSNFDEFGDNYNMDNVPVFSNYVQRNKRSTIHKQNQRLRNSLRKCKDKMNCINKDENNKILYKSKFISQLRPASLFNDYPYEVAVLLTNSNKREIKNNEKTESEVDNLIETDKKVKENVLENKQYEHNKTEHTDYKPLDGNVTVTNNKTSFDIHKRHMTHPELELEIKDKTIEDANNETKHIDGNKINRNVFEKEERIWQSAPVQNINVLPRPDSSTKNKPVTEKGLVKVLSLLTKTFKKVMKQHTEIQEIDNKLHSLNEEFMKNVAVLDSKFQEFDTKYKHLVEINEELQLLNSRFNKKTNDLEHRDTEMANNLREFEKQQKNFLAQQQQFYTIQKFMLEQNEKINRKQSLIAKTQSEISHRQNHFARVLKKAKQFYMDNKFLTGSKLSSILYKPKNSSALKVHDSNDSNKINTATTPPTPESTESVKINLFSIPKISPLLNHDKLILEEKHDQTVDDLVYKYYFNNTFIDNLMKSKVLTAIIDNEGKNTRNAKNKRNDWNNETTILLPVGNINESPKVNNNLHRERRWIRHPNKVFRKFHGNEAINNEKLLTGVKESKTKENKKGKNDPYFTMATNFCTEIGQNLNAQVLNWCVEKSLRRLKTIDIISPFKVVAPLTVENKPDKTVLPMGNGVSVPDTTKLFPLKTSTQAEDAAYTSSPPITTSPENAKNTVMNALNTGKNPNLFFPDNDELESNLKEYELKPDSEGTVYFDGSLHTSDIVISASDALSDIMPGLDSNSHVEVDPLAIDLQARRRAYVRRLNQNILKMNS